ncbi:class I SAM-dependent methyltransferase [Amycolatopsis sp. QT-25]|uniref:class I SAM-dependent methyltransferase n=1 Tax=Amycolatopsis sp. QT-25 TaxID=3034022 RepID=UPI0023EB1E34|nr:class I SAM-dependent methyltransferase [Amycolatopsis sp. QT-25]WET81654.1 class I SAM-dependent methyltransferase [Amycolatopsis sp. QT-25]
MSDGSNADGELARELFNGFIGSHVLYALITTGVLDQLAEREGAAVVGELARRGDCSLRLLSALLKAANRLGIVRYRPQGDTVELTAGGRQAHRLRGYFTASVGGFGDVFRNLDALALGREKFGESIDQDGRLTAVGCAQNWSFQQAIFDRATERIDYRHVLDLGCGAGVRLVHLLRRNPHARGTGIDRSPEACALARDRAHVMGVGDRVTIVQADVGEIVTGPDGCPGLLDVDLATSYFVLHHFMQSRAGGVDFLKSLAVALPGCDHFVFADGFAEPEEARGSPPLFTLAYELFHEFTDVALVTHRRQCELFEQAGYLVEQDLGFGHPLEHLFVLRRS